MGLSSIFHTIRAVLSETWHINHPEKTWRSLANHPTPLGVASITLGYDEVPD